MGPNLSSCCLGSLLMIWGGLRGKPVRVEVMMGVARVAVERQARKRKEIATAIPACVDPTVLFAPHSIQLTGVNEWAATTKGRSQKGTVLPLQLREPATGAWCRLPPVRFVVRGKFGPGWLRRHLPPDVGLRPVRTQEKAAGLSSDWWKTHLQAPAKSNSYKTVVVFNYCVDTGKDFVKIWLDVYLSKI